MSERWSLVTAAGVIAVVCLGFGIGLWAGGGSHHVDDNYRAPQPYSGHLTADTFWQSHSGNRESYQTVCDSPIDGSQADLCQQWRAANAAGQSADDANWSVVLSAIGIVGLLYTVYLSNKATKAATQATEAAVRSADAAEKAYFAENRPWMDVTVENADQGLIFAEPAITMSFNVTAKNIGSVPAIDVQVFGEVIKSGAFSAADATSVDRAIQRAERRHHTNTIVFPEKETGLNFRNYPAIDDPKTLEFHRHMLEMNPQGLPDHINISLIFGVRYRSVANGEWYYSAYMAIVSKKSGEPFRMGDIVAPENLNGMVLPDNAKLT